MNQPPSWLYGLQDYFEFENNYIAKLFVDQLISVYFSEDKPNSVKNLCLSDGGDPSEKLSRFNFYFKLLQDNPIEFVETVSVMRKRLPDTEILDIFHKYGRNDYDMNALADAFSRGQVRSKIWLVEELKKVQNNFEMIHIHAGWFGQSRLYFDKAGIDYDKIRILETDHIAAQVSDYVFNIDQIEGYRVKSGEARLPMINDAEEVKEMNWVTRTGFEYKIKNYKKDTEYLEKTNPDLIINTSAEHFNSSWYHKFCIRAECDPLYVIQSNNLFNIPEHYNCVHSIEHMLKKFPMERLEYAGELELPGYKRFMLIGRP